MMCYNQTVALYTAAENHYLDIDQEIRAEYRWEFLERTEQIATCLAALPLALDQNFADDAQIVPSKVMALKCAVNVYYRCDNAYYAGDIQRYAEMIRAYEPDYQTPSYQSGRGAATSGGCYVATAVYGSYDCPQVWTLRRYRDNILAESFLGRAFIHLYYAVSPALVRWFGDSCLFKRFWRPVLDKMVDRLKRDGIADTPYNDRQW